ncbi:hypothetical protein [Sporosarcina jiandibaonis]|nr:hypothetical protein [Sporosarcina jiandibaonis]
MLTFIVILVLAFLLIGQQVNINRLEDRVEDLEIAYLEEKFKGVDEE